MADSDYTIDRASVEEPPQAPSIHRSIRVSPVRAVFIGLCLLVVVSALAGVFGESRGETREQNATVEMIIDYPSRYRYRQINKVQIEIRNRSGQAIDTLTVDLDPGYTEKFSNINGVPPFTDAWSVDLTNVLPGESQRVVVELQAERYGMHNGTISAFTREMDTLKAEVGTFIFP